MKVLIISHNSFSTYQNMGKTFLSLFSGFGPEELCQLYIYPNIPNTPACGSCWRVTDREILAGLRPGREIDNALIAEENPLFERNSDKALYRSPANGSPVRRLLRDMVWKLSRWDNPGLNRWLDREKPDCIFLAPGYAKFIYDIALRIAQRRDLPIVTYLCDDYYFVKPAAAPAGRLYQRQLNRKIEALMAKTAHLVTISPEMAERYGTFGVPTTTIMTGASSISRSIRSAQPHSLCYFGNLRLGRNHTLAMIGRELDAINAERGTEFTLDIYSAEQNREVLSAFDGVPSIRLRGFVTGEDYRTAMDEAGLLLHVEGMDGKSADRVKFSLSTKIADSLGSGIPLVACGPEAVASMAHLRRNGCALTATAKSELRQTLLTAFFDGEARAQTAARGLATAEKFHHKESNSALLRSVLTQAAEGHKRERG